MPCIGGTEVENWYLREFENKSGNRYTFQMKLNQQTNKINRNLNKLKA